MIFVRNILQVKKMAESVSALSNSLTELIAINGSRYGQCPGKYC